MKFYFYYDRDENYAPVRTTCLLVTENGEMAKGIAVCSPNDQPRKKIGRSISYGRAAKALRTQTSKLFSNHNPILTEFEKKIISSGRV